MQPGRASKTAEHNALFRALDRLLPRDERLVDDPLSEGFLSWKYRSVTAAARLPGVARGVRRILDRQWPGVRSSVAARTRLIDGLVEAAEQVQVVILGAGYDTRVYRLESLRGRTVFEVDHPDTQRRKRALLERRGVVTSHVQFVPTDFHLGRLAIAMADHGYQPSEPTLFLWEGTTNYLDAEAVDATLRWCAEAARGSELIFTYINEDVFSDASKYQGAERVLGALDREHEPMQFGLAPERLASYLAERGLELMTDVGAAQYRERFYGPRATRMPGHEFYRVAHARVTANIRV
jgi:methyltransferase (TIGR00027 family)